jgi:GT2 family glycosyltransferase
MAAAPLISIVVPVRNGGPAFEACLRGLARLSPSPHEIIVVDDESEDDSAARAAAIGARVVETVSTHGPAAARNLGVRHATGTIIWFVDADVVVPADGIRRVGGALTDPSIAAVIGSYDNRPTEPNFLSQFKNLAHRYVHQQGRDEAFTFWGACGAIRRNEFETVGGFDERYRQPSIEDIELGYRLRRAGRQIRLVKTLEVTHLKRWTLVTLLRADICYRAVPWSELILREGRLDSDLNLGVRTRIGVATAPALVAGTAVAISDARLRPVAAGLAAVLLAVDWPFLRYLARERGPVFAARAIPWQWLYYLYSGASFLTAVIRRLAKRGPSRRTAEA